MIGSKFNPLDYDMLHCAECSTPIPMNAWDVDLARVQMAAGPREVPGLYVCKECVSHAVHVEPIAAFVWLTSVIIPEGLRFAKSVADDEDAPLLLAVSGLMIAQDVQAGNDLANDLARELAAVEQPAHAAGPVDGDAPADPFPADEGDVIAARELVAQLDMRRDADGVITYACPNPVCPVGRHGFAELVDALPMHIVVALMDAIPE